MVISRIRAYFFASVIILSLLFTGCSSAGITEPIESTATPPLESTATPPQPTAEQTAVITPEPVVISGNWDTTLVEDFSGELNWTVSGGSLESDTENHILGDRSIAMTTETQDNYVTISSPVDAYDIDLSGAYLRVTLRCEDITNFRMLNIIACSGDYSNYYRWVLVPQGTTGNSQNLITSGDWVTLSLSLSEALITGAPDAAHITALRIQCKDDGARVRLNIQKIETANYQETPFAGGVVSIVFDDGWASTYDLAKPMMDAAGYSGTTYLITEYLDNELSGYLSWDQVKNLQGDGWEIGGHAGYKSTHGSSEGLILLTDEEIRGDFEQIILDFGSHGLGVPTGLAYPKGYYDMRVEAIAEEYFQYARTINKCSGIETVIPGELFRLRAMSSISSCSGGNSIDSITGEGGLLDLCQTGGWAILVFHEITDGEAQTKDQCSASDFQAILDAITGRGLTCLPVADVLQAVDNP